MIASGAGLAAVLLIVAAVLFRRKRSLKTEYFQQQWKELQKMCASRESWSQAVIGADQLLDKALKKRRIGGKTMGERMVRAQRTFSDNDGVWFGHKLRSKIESEPDMKLKENEVKSALIAIRQALKDLGALPK
jgi:hypothetical protein